MTGVLGSLVASIKKILSWSSQNIGATAFHQFSAFAPQANSNFIIVNTGTTNTTGSSSAYRYSLDGVTWNGGTLPAVLSPRALVSNGSRIVFSHTGATAAYYTDNGTTWTAVAAWTVNNIKTDGLYDGTNFVLTQRSTAEGIRYSPNGTSWSTTATPIQPEAIGYYDGTYIIGAVGGAARSYTGTLTASPTWNTITFPISFSSIESIKHNGNVWLVCQAGSANAAISSNGTTWTAVTLPAAFGVSATGVRPKIGVVDGRFYFLSGNSTNATVWVSSNGSTWTALSTVASVQITPISVTSGFGKILIVGLRSGPNSMATIVKGE